MSGGTGAAYSSFMHFLDSDDTDPLVTIAHFVSEQQFLFARMALESAGVEVFAPNEHLTRISGGIYNGFTGGITLQVRASDADSAQQILNSERPYLVKSDQPDDNR